MSEKDLGYVTIQGTVENARKTRKRIPFSGEVVWALELRRQTERYLREDGTSTHTIPESSEELDSGQKYTARLKDIMEDPILGFRLASRLMAVADGMMADGEITEIQYLSVNDTYRQVSLGKNYKPMETPEIYIYTYGSVNPDLNKEPLYALDDVTVK